MYSYEPVIFFLPKVTQWCRAESLATACHNILIIGHIFSTIVSTYIYMNQYNNLCENFRLTLKSGESVPSTEKILHCAFKFKPMAMRRIVSSLVTIRKLVPITDTTWQYYGFSLHLYRYSYSTHRKYLTNFVHPILVKGNKCSCKLNKF